jgi:PEGA domain
MNMLPSQRSGVTWVFSALLISFVFSLISFAQTERQRNVTEKNIDADLKSLLNDFYSGKPVRSKVVIPANEQGLEILDGRLNVQPLANLQAAVQPGEMILIRELRFKNKVIEVHFNNDNRNEDAPPLSLQPVGEYGSEVSARPSVAATKLAERKKTFPDPRLMLRFSREIGTQDLNLQSINRLLSSAIDVTNLDPNNRIKIPEPPTAPVATLLPAGVSAAEITGEMPNARIGIGEVTIECNVPGARLYLDGSYSGIAPRTVQIIGGVHSVLIVAPGYESFEKKYFFTSGKISIIRAELNPKNK